MADWMEQQISDPDEVEDEEAAKEQTEAATEEPAEERTEFEKQMRTLLATTSLETLSPEVIEANIDECSDVEALEKAVDVEERERPLELYEARLAELTDDADAGGDAGADPDESTADSEGAESDAEPAESEETVGPGPFGTSPEDASVEPDEPDTTTDDPVEPAPEDTDADDNTPTDDGAGVPVSVETIAPDALTVSEAAQLARRWTTLVWGEPGLGKSHFGMTGQPPVCVIDTEGKADELAHKFTDSAYDDPFIWQPSNFDEALRALEQAIDLLDAFHDQEGVVGTIVVDSMSVMWGWSQQKYVDKFYPNADDPSEVELSTGFGSGKSDWKQIKNYHNVQFRQRMIDTPYHLTWTAMSEDDYEAQLNEGSRDAEKPAGEKENVYKVDEVIRLKEGSDGAPVAVLQKSGKVKHRYTGLRYPTFQKHKQVIEAIDSAENGNGTIASVESKYGVSIVEGNPEYISDDE